MKTQFLSALWTCALALCALVVWAQLDGDPAWAQSVKETTFVKRGGNVIVVRTMAPAQVLSVNPYIDAKKGKKSGRLNMEIVLRNVAAKPQVYSVFGQGKTRTGGWLGGVGNAPGKGKLDPGKETTAKIRTGYEGSSVPQEMRVDVFLPQ